MQGQRDSDTGEDNFIASVYFKNNFQPAGVMSVPQQWTQAMHVFPFTSCLCILFLKRGF